ncbi:hypothetical protein ACQKML_02110 [Peribacillus frigoritolerans]
MYFILAMLSFIIFCMWKKYDYVYLLYIISIIAIPSNSYIENKIGVDIYFDVRDIMAICMLVIIIMNKKKYLSFNIPQLLFYSVAFLIFLISVAIGIVNDNRFLSYEIQLYPFLIIKICAFIGWIKTFKIGMSTLIHGFVLSSLCYSIFTILLYFFGQNLLNEIYGSFYGDIWNSSGRVGFKNTTVLLIINLFSIYMIYSQKRIVLNSVNIILGSTSILISQTRSIIILYLLILFVLFVSFIIKSALSNLNSRTYLIFSIASFTIPFAFLIGFIVFNTDNLLIDSVKSRMFESNGGSLDSRKYTNQYNIGMIENNIIGDGLGKEMYFLGSNSQLISIDTWIDNLFIYILVKFGLIGLFLFILIVMIGLFKYIKEAIIKKNVLTFIILIAYVPFIIITTFMTSQLLHSQQVYITFAFLFFICCKEKYFKNINQNVV